MKERMKNRVKVIAIMSLLGIMLTACAHGETSVQNRDSAEEKNERILVYDDVKFLPIYKEEEKEKLYEQYKGNFSTIQCAGEDLNTKYYNDKGVLLGTLEEDVAYFIDDETHNIAIICNTSSSDEEERLSKMVWPISKFIKISLETLNKLPEEPDWSKISAWDILQDNINNYGLFPEKNIKRDEKGNVDFLLDDSGNLIGIISGTNTALFRKENNLVVVRFWGYGFRTVSRQMYNLEIGKDSFDHENYFRLADNTPFYYLAEDGLYYYTVEAGIKKTIKVTDKVNCKEYEVFTISNEIKNVRYPVFKRRDNKDENEIFIFPLDGCKGICDFWFYEIE